MFNTDTNTNASAPVVFTELASVELMVATLEALAAL